MINNDYKYFVKLFYYPLALLPFFLITGPFLSDLVITLSGLGFLLINLKNKNYFFFNNFFFKYFLLFYLLISFSYFFYEESNISYLVKPLTMIRFVFFTLAMGFIINHKKSFIDLFFKVIIFCLMILFIDSIIQSIFGKNIFNFEISKTGRVSSFFQDELIMGSYISRIYPILIAIIFYKNYMNKNLLTVFSFITCTILILLSGERTALILFLIFTILFILFSSDFIQRKFLFLSSIFIIIFTLIFLNASLKTRFVDNVIFFLKGENSDKKIKIISDEHQGIYYSAYKIFVKNPVIGTGVNSFKIKCKDVIYKDNDKYFTTFKCSSHPHNIYLQLLSETGIVPFLMIFSIFFYFSIKFLKILLKKIKIQNYNISLYSSFILTLFPLAPSGNMFNNWLSIFFFLPAAFYFGLNKKFYKNNIKIYNEKSI